MALPDIELTLMSNASANGDAQKLQRGGKFAFAVDGTFNSGTVKLQIRSPDGTSWLDIGADATLSAEGVIGVELPAGEYRAAITGTPSALYATLKEIRTLG